MPVEIHDVDVEDDIGDLKLAEFICEGCGETIDEKEMYADEAQRHADARPIHNDLDCRKQAKENSKNAGDADE